MCGKIVWCRIYRCLAYTCRRCVYIAGTRADPIPHTCHHPQGSTGKTTLRPAGGADVQIFEGAHEIVSLSGTIGVGGTPDGSIHGGVDGEMHHLHMAISDSTCSVVGGHVMPGCIVRTTAEIVLLEIDGLAFTRPHDPTTGYAELSITERIATSKLQAGMPVLVIGAALLLGLVIGQGTR